MIRGACWASKGDVGQDNKRGRFLIKFLSSWERKLRVYTGGVVEDDIKLFSPVVGGVVVCLHNGHWIRCTTLKYF